MVVSSPRGAVLTRVGGRGAGIRGRRQFDHVGLHALQPRTCLLRGALQDLVRPAALVLEREGDEVGLLHRLGGREHVAKGFRLDLAQGVEVDRAEGRVALQHAVLEEPARLQLGVAATLQPRDQLGHHRFPAVQALLQELLGRLVGVRQGIPFGDAVSVRIRRAIAVPVDRSGVAVGPLRVRISVKQQRCDAGNRHGSHQEQPTHRYTAFWRPASILRSASSIAARFVATFSRSE